MNRGFYIILIAQFLSALADNALLFAAIALLSSLHAPDWHKPLLLEFFVISYIALAPFVGSFADAIPVVGDHHFAAQPGTPNMFGLIQASEAIEQGK